MSTYEECLASFTAWPHASPTPKQMARAGFKHMPINQYLDNVSCSCGDGNHDLCGWKPDDDPKLQLHIHNYRCSRLWMVLATTERKIPSTKDLGFFDPSLEYDFPELSLFQNVKIFCNRLRRLRFFETDILDLLPKCLRGKALEWFNQSDFQDLATCLGAMRARFWQQAPPEGPPEAPQATLEGPPGARFQRQAPQEAPPEAPPRAPEYHHCKLCNASFSSIARLMRHTQENICNKPSCRHCEKVFSSKNQLHRHLREECQKQRHRSSPSSSSPAWPSRSSSLPSSRSSPQSSPTCSQACSPPPPTPRIPSPPPAYRAISPSPPSYLTIADLSARYAKPPCLKVNDLFRMFGGSSATKSSITITGTIDNPFTRPFISLLNQNLNRWIRKKSIGSMQTWELGMATSHHRIALAQCSPPRCGRTPQLLDTDKGASYAKFGLAPLPSR